MKDQFDQTETVVLWQVKKEANQAKYDTSLSSEAFVAWEIEFRGSAQSVGLLTLS